jgi:predicted outer membrane protein
MSADSGFDKAFIREQIRLHNQEIIALKMFGGAAKDDDLKDEVKRTMPVLERHLARAREVAAQIGVPIDSAGTTPQPTTTSKPPR